MNRWIIFRFKVVSYLTNDDNSWPTFRIATDFDDMNKELFFYGLLISETLFSNLFLERMDSIDFGGQQVKGPSQWTRREKSCEPNAHSTEVCFLVKLGRHFTHSKPY